MGAGMAAGQLGPGSRGLLSRSFGAGRRGGLADAACTGGGARVHWPLVLCERRRHAVRMGGQVGRAQCAPPPFGGSACCVMPRFRLASNFVFSNLSLFRPSRFGGRRGHRHPTLSRRSTVSSVGLSRRRSAYGRGLQRSPSCFCASAPASQRGASAPRISGGASSAGQAAVRRVAGAAVPAVARGVSAVPRRCLGARAQACGRLRFGICRSGRRARGRGACHSKVGGVRGPGSSLGRCPPIDASPTKTTT